MGRPTTSEQALYKLAKARGYEPGVHRAVDVINAEKPRYLPKTIQGQESALKRYEE